jgi:16S rRNA (guanine(1405)-N(7))-methyltransferase
MARAAEDEATAADDLTRRILSSAKYRNLDQALVHRVATEAVQRIRDRGQRVKYAKRKLHQAFGAFLAGSPAGAVTAMVTAVQLGEADLRTAARAAMTAHASSAERIAWLEPFYDQVAEWCGTPSSVADLACGLNPLAIPWMQLAPDATYWACEIDTELVAALAGLDEIMPARLRAVACDLVASPPAVRADVALMLKTVTTVEQQEAGSAARLLSALDCDHVVLSLPRRSLSASRAYTDDAEAIVAQVVGGTCYRVRGEAVFGTEVGYHLAPEAAARQRRGG